MLKLIGFDGRSVGRFVTHNPKVQQDWTSVIIPLTLPGKNLRTILSLRGDDALHGLESILIREAAFSQHMSEIEEWCEHHINGRWTVGRERSEHLEMYGRYFTVYRFKARRDALFFIMRFQCL